MQSEDAVVGSFLYFYIFQSYYYHHYALRPEIVIRIRRPIRNMIISRVCVCVCVFFRNPAHSLVLQNNTKPRHGSSRRTENHFENTKSPLPIRNNYCYVIIITRDARCIILLLFA